MKKGVSTEIKRRQQEKGGCNTDNSRKEAFAKKYSKRLQ